MRIWPRNYGAVVGTFFRAKILDQKIFQFSDWKTVAKWLVEHKRAEVGPNTWVLYRNAVIHVAGQAEVDAILNVPPVHKKADIPRRGPGLRQKHLKPADMAALERWVRSRRLRYGPATITWLHATLLTGLRPNEWRRAEMRPMVGPDGLDIPVLEVVNAKRDGTANSTRIAEFEYDRRIPLSHLDDTDLALIQDQLEAAKLMDKSGAFDEFLRGCQNVIYRAAIFLWARRTRRPDLYSARHQFCANCKAADLSKEEIAVLMGHRSIHTQTNQYGRRSSGQQVPVPVPFALDVERAFGVGANSGGAGRSGERIRDRLRGGAGGKGARAGRVL